MYQEIKGLKAKVEVSNDAMNKEITQISQVTKGEKDAFLEFQRMVADSKKGETLGGIMTQVQQKYPDFQIKGFDKLSATIEEKRDEFAIVQEQYNDRVVAYNSFIVGKMNKIFLPDSLKPLAQFVVSSAKTKDAMQTGKDELQEIKF